jgi:hypothetical protein
VKRDINHIFFVYLEDENCLEHPTTKRRKYDCSIRIYLTMCAEFSSTISYAMHDILYGGNNSIREPNIFSSLFNTVETNKLGEGLLRMKKFVIIEDSNIPNYNCEQIVTISDNTVALSVCTDLVGSLTAQLRAVFIMSAFKAFVSRICSRMTLHYPKVSVITSGIVMLGSELSGQDMSRPSISNLRIVNDQSMTMVVCVLKCQEFWTNTTLVKGIYVVETCNNGILTVRELLDSVRSQVGPESDHPFNAVWLLSTLL